MLEHPLGEPTSPDARLKSLREKLMPLDAAAAVGYFQLQDYNQLLKSTISLCPECLKHVPALVFARGVQVQIRKHCEQHGFSEAVLENDLEFYHLSNKDRW